MQNATSTSAALSNASAAMPTCANANTAQARPEGSLLLQGPDGLQVTVHPFGASWLGACVPLRSGDLREAVLGMPTLQALLDNRSCVGGTVGRYANRIAGARLQRGSLSWPLETEAPLRHQLHSGPRGFHRRHWQLLHQSSDAAVFSMHSPDGDQGFPGELQVQVTYRALPGCTLNVRFQAQLRGHATPLAMTNHAYFQLDGLRPGVPPQDVRQQTLQLNAALVLPTDGEGLPAGPLQPVAGGPLDFRAPRPIGQALDHAFLLQPGGGARVVAADGRLALHIESSLPALQAYTGAYLASGTQGLWPAFSGLALEPGFLPDSPHHPEWPQPSCWLEPGQDWDHHIRYRFEAL